MVTGVLHGARVAVLAGRRVERVQTARVGVANVVGARVQVITGQVVGDDHASDRRVAHLRGAGEAVVAVALSAHNAHTIPAHVWPGAQVAVLAGGIVRGLGAAAQRVAAVVRARVAVPGAGETYACISDAGAPLAAFWTDDIRWRILAGTVDAHPWKAVVAQVVRVQADSFRRRFTHQPLAELTTTLIGFSVAVIVLAITRIQPQSATILEANTACRAAR